MIPPHELHPLLRTYGGWLVGGVVALESLGVPVPGETVVVAAALYAAAGHGPDIGIVVLAAAAGAVLGGMAGYAIGAKLGTRLLERFGRRVGLTRARLRLGRYLFLRHGAKVVFFGRFVAVLRAFAALLAGANRMGWRAFLIPNAAGGIVWAALYGFGAYWFGEQALRLARPLGIAFGLGAVIAVLGSALVIRRNEARLQAEADCHFAEPPDDRPS